MAMGLGDVLYMLMEHFLGRCPKLAVIVHLRRAGGPSLEVGKVVAELS